MMLMGPLVITLLLELIVVSSGQGLTPSDKNTLGSGPAVGALDPWYSKALQQRRTLQANPNTPPPTRASDRSLGAARSTQDDAETYWVWTLAASPSGYSALNTTQTGGLQPVPPPEDQGDCDTCVAFAVAAAADLAVAFALRRNAAQVDGISPQDLYHCGEELRLCRSGWNYRASLDILKRRTAAGDLRTPACLPYRPDKLEQEAQQDLCTPPDRRRCQARPTALRGRFEYAPLNDVVRVQRHIRNHGSVLTRLQVYPDFEPFFRRRPDGIYTRASTAAPNSNSSSSSSRRQPVGTNRWPIEHAVVVVGYDNDGQFWVMRNSWGDNFAQGGYFRVSYKADIGVLSPGDTFGLRWFPSDDAAAVRPRLRSLAPDDTGCYSMQASAVDWLADVSYRLNIRTLSDLVARNVRSGVVTQLDVAPVGRNLVVCDIGRTVPVSKEATLSIVGSPSRTFGTTTNALASQREQQITGVVDQRRTFLAQGPLTQLCLLTGGWWSPILRSRHGNGTLATHGGYDKVNNLYSTCLGLQPGEVITRIAIKDGFWLDGLLLETNKQPGVVHLGGGRVQNATRAEFVDLVPPEEGAFVAGFTLYVGRPILTGLQVHWGCYKAGDACVPQ